MISSADPIATRIAWIVAAIITGITLWMLTIPPAHAQTLQDHIDTYCKVDCVNADKVVDVAYRAGQSYGFDYKTFLAIIHVESKFHTKAKNGRSVGLTQSLLTYHRPKFRGKNYFAIEDNMFVGAEIFGDCVRRHRGNYQAATTCYNGGGDRRYWSKVQRALKVIRGLELPRPSLDPLGEFIIRMASR